LIDIETARSKLLETLNAGRSSEESFAITKIVEEAFGWVFFYTSQKFMETQDLKDLLPGKGPAIVERESGAVQFLGTEKRPEIFIREYQERWNKRAKLN
jgi:hypothetical protein